MIALIKYNYKIYMKENKFFIPLIFFVLFHGIFYSTGTEKFVPGIIVGASVIFVIMIWTSFTYCELQDSRTEQITYLKVNNANIYWISKVLFMFSIGVISSLFGVVFPLVRTISSSDDISINNFVLAFFILVIASFMGILIGMIFQTKVIGDRGKALAVLILITLISIVKIPIGKEYPFAKAITWIVPPINDIATSCMEMHDFSLRLLLIPMAFATVYIIIEVFIYMKLMKKILF